MACIHPADLPVRGYPNVLRTMSAVVLFDLAPASTTFSKPGVGKVVIVAFPEIIGFGGKISKLTESLVFGSVQLRCPWFEGVSRVPRSHRRHEVLLSALAAEGDGKQ